MIDPRQNMSDAQIRNLLAGQSIAVATVSPYIIVVADTWTSDGAGGWYWDLVHNLGRKIVPVQLYDNVTNDYVFRVKSMRPLTGSETTTLRITLTYHADDDRIEVGYL